MRISEPSDHRGAVPVRYFSLNGATPQDVDGEVVEEGLACISLNGEELATFMCSPRDLEKMALGFLLNEGIITGLADVADLRIAANGTCVDVWLTKGKWSRPRRTIITAGCGGGITFDDLSQMHPPLEATTQAERFGLPILTFIDTPGAYPGVGAEERGQSEAIARNLLEMARFEVPIICTVIGEGGSGGALAIGGGDRTLMLEFGTYSVTSPEGCASILWKSADKARDAAEALALTAPRLPRPRRTPAAGAPPRARARAR